MGGGEAVHLGGPMWEALVILGATDVVIPLFHRMWISMMLGFMLVGVLLGPSGLGALAGRAPWLSAVTMYDRDRIAAVSELGLVLLFMIGLELSFERIVTMRRLVFGLGAMQVSACALLVGGCAALLGVALR